MGVQEQRQHWESWRRFIEIWHLEFDRKAVRVSELLPYAEDAGVPLAGETLKGLETSLGLKLKALEDVPVNGLWVRKSVQSEGWEVVQSRPREKRPSQKRGHSSASPAHHPVVVTPIRVTPPVNKKGRSQLHLVGRERKRA